MPWSTVSPMDQRLQFVAEYLTGLYSMTELAASYGVSRRIGYYWVDRYQRDGHLAPTLAAAAYQPARRRRRRSSGGIQAARRRASHAGAPASCATGSTRRDPTTAWPCRDTIHEVLRRQGLVRQRVRRRPALHPPVHLTAPTEPNLAVDHRLQGRISHRRRRLVLSLHVARRLHALRLALHGAADAYPRRHPAGIRPRLSHLRTPRSHPQR